MLKKTYHMHTVVCGHAENLPEDLIKLAIAEGYEEIGISEHIPLDKNPARAIDWDKLVDLIAQLQVLREKYKKQISVRIGLESEYHIDSKYWYDKVARIPNIEYIIYGYHYLGDPNKPEAQFLNTMSGQALLDKWSSEVVTALNTGYYSCFAHPDNFLNGYKAWDKPAMEAVDKIVEAAIKNDVVLEFNINGINTKEKHPEDSPKNRFHYPVKDFWQYVGQKDNVKVIIGADAHDPYTLTQASISRGVKYVEEWGVKDKLVDTIRMDYLKKVL